MKPFFMGDAVSEVTFLVVTVLCIRVVAVNLNHTRPALNRKSQMVRWSDGVRIDPIARRFVDSRSVVRRASAGNDVIIVARS